jgi:hypothetical protein
MTAFQSMRLSAQGAPETPKGGSDDSRLKSRISRRRQAVDWVPRDEEFSKCRQMTAGMSRRLTMSSAAA